MKTKKQYLAEINKAINAVEKLQNNQSITGVYLDNDCISKFIITLYNVKEVIEKDNE